MSFSFYSLVSTVTKGRLCVPCACAHVLASPACELFSRFDVKWSSSKVMYSSLQLKLKLHLLTEPHLMQHPNPDCADTPTPDPAPSEET